MQLLRRSNAAGADVRYPGRPLITAVRACTAESGSSREVDGVGFRHRRPEIGRRADA
jgi:hypothetical protein